MKIIISLFLAVAGLIFVSSCESVEENEHHHHGSITTTTTEETTVSRPRASSVETQTIRSY